MFITDDILYVLRREQARSTRIRGMMAVMMQRLLKVRLAKIMCFLLQFFLEREKAMSKFFSKDFVVLTFRISF